MADGGNIVSVNFEIFGKVQGVFFRKVSTDLSQVIKEAGHHRAVYRHLDAPAPKIGITMSIKNNSKPVEINNLTWFNANTQKKANSLNLVGWVRNTGHNTVKGQVEGPREAVKEMKEWLATKGSKNSRIDKAEFSNEKTISTKSFKSFTVRR